MLFPIIQPMIDKNFGNHIIKLSLPTAYAKKLSCLKIIFKSCQTCDQILAGRELMGRPLNYKFIIDGIVSKDINIALKECISS